MGRPRHRRFNARRFLDKFQGREEILRAFVERWRGRIPLDIEGLDVPAFERFLADAEWDGMDEMLERLYRAYDLATDDGREGLVAACRERGLDPDPAEALPPECLSLKTLVENEDVFTAAYDLYAYRSADRFSIYTAKTPGEIADPAAVERRLLEALSAAFLLDKKSERVAVHHHRDGRRAIFIVYHERRTRAELVFDRPDRADRRTRVVPAVFRPAQQDLLSYDPATGVLEVEARLEREARILRRAFGGAAFDDEERFDAPDAARWFRLERIADDDFRLDADGGRRGVLKEIHFRTGSENVSIRSKDALNDARRTYGNRLSHATITKAVLSVPLSGARRPLRVEIAGTNRLKFNRSVPADDLLGHLVRWGIVDG